MGESVRSLTLKLRKCESSDVPILKSKSDVFYCVVISSDLQIEGTVCSEVSVGVNEKDNVDGYELCQAFFLPT